jgi:hypothetical protein
MIMGTVAGRNRSTLRKSNLRPNRLADLKSPTVK